MILGIQFDKKGSLESNREKLVSLLSEITKALKNSHWNVGKLQEILSCWNRFLLLARPEKSALQNCYEPAGSGKEYVTVTNEAKLEFRLLMALRSPLHGDIYKA